MTQSLPPAQKDAESFCNTCQWVYNCWAFHVNLFHNVPSNLDSLSQEASYEFNETPYGICLFHLQEVSLKFVILEISKLHDPPTQGKYKNLSIELFEKHVSWTKGEEIEVAKIIAELSPSAKKIKPARDKIIAHNDREIIVTEKDLDGFFEGEDDRYFEFLGKLCTLIWAKLGPKRTPDERNRIFEFTRVGFEGDTLGTANAAREFCKLLVNAFSRDFT